MSTNSNKGFTLIETLIAISILVLALTGAFSAAQNGVSSAIFSKDQIVAFYLAQEGIEQIRNMRDENAVDSDTEDTWLSGIAESGDPCAPLGSKCTVDAPNNALAACSGECPKLKLNTNDFYVHNTGVDTQFTREIQITAVPGSTQEVVVTATVKWSKGLVNRTFVARENLFNWQ